MPTRYMHKKFVANTAHCNEKWQYFGTPFVSDQPQFQYCFRLYDTAPRIIEGMFQSVQYCSYLRGNRLPYIIYFIARLLKIRWSSGHGVGSPFSRRVAEMVQILNGTMKIFFSWTESISCQIVLSFASGKIYKQLTLQYFIGLFPFHWYPNLSRVASKSGILLSLQNSAYTL